MIRSFNLRDWRLLTRLGEHSVPLNTSTVLLERDTPLQGAFMPALFNRTRKTLVWRPNARDVEAFVQYRIVHDGSLAHLLWLGSRIPSHNHNGSGDNGHDAHVHEDVWVGLFDRLSITLGDAGIQTLIAEVPEESDAYHALKESGFVPYTRQQIWRLTRFDGAGNPLVLSDMQTTSDWDVTKLYHKVVPNLIRMIEPDPPISRDSWVRYEQNSAVAYANVKSGQIGMLLWLLVSLEAQVDPLPLIRGMVARKPPTPEIPLYCAIRNYQEWLNGSLEQIGFELVANHVVMVKHTVQHVRHRVQSIEERLLAAQRAQARTSPVIHPNNQSYEPPDRQG